MASQFFKRLLLIYNSGWGQGPQDKKNPPRSPGHGKKDPSQELDEMWRDITNKLNKLFGGGNNQRKNPFQTPNAPKPPSRLFPKVVLGLWALGAIWMASGVYTVSEGEVAVVTRFGRYVSTQGSGMNWHFPAPIQAHDIVNVSQLRSVKISTSSSTMRGASRPIINPDRQENTIQSDENLDNTAWMLTNDLNIVSVDFDVNYRIGNDTESARRFTFENRDPESSVRDAAESAMREVVGNKTMDEALYEQREAIASEAKTLIQNLVTSFNTGIEIDSVLITNVQPPKPVQAAFDDANRAAQDKARAINEGVADANNIIPRAHGQAQRLESEAHGYSARVVEQAKGDIARFNAIYEQYKLAPQVTRDRMYIESIEQVLSNTSKVYVDIKGGNNMLYLPLDQLLNKSTPSGNADGTNSTTVPSGSNANTGVSSPSSTVSPSQSGVASTTVTPSTRATVTPNSGVTGSSTNNNTTADRASRLDARSRP